MQTELRKPNLQEIPQICEMLAPFAANEEFLPRTERNVLTALREYTVAEHAGEIVGVVSLALSSNKRAELGVLVGPEEVRSALFDATVQEALSFGCQEIFVLTAQPEQYKALGFTRTTLEALPEKRDEQCLRCSRLARCQQVAMAYAVEVPLTAVA